ncbi:MAG: single-stranded DNA-binding protein [Ruminococcus sp.]|jgi:single-strand DNA-binding protein|nr:single-stranded DNA-binding protein [Ruminococcus sp.]
MLNTVILMGRLTANPELRQTNSGNTSCSFTVAIDRGTSPTGERQTDFIRCVAWNKQAEFMSKFTEKGSMIIVEGSLRTGSYTDKKYPDVTHYTTDVWANRVSFGETKAAHELSKQNSGGGYGGNSYGGNSGNNYGGNSGGNYGGNNNYGTNNSGGNSGGGFGGNNTRANPPASNPFDNFPPQIGGLSDFEEVISDSDLPF